MKKGLGLYLKHIGWTLLSLIILMTVVLWYVGAAVHYSDHPMLMSVDGEGPYAFYSEDSILDVRYIRGNRDDGFVMELSSYHIDSQPTVSCTFLRDSSYFSFDINTKVETTPSEYHTDQPIVAISDIEGSFAAFRDFLLVHKVINEDLNWSFGKGHLVLVGDMVDRGASVTQVLWLIYKLEREARTQGGHVHYIIGNHELYNMQGNYKSASPKYYGVASILGKQHHSLYDDSSVLGRWMASKNTIEKINRHLFVHGGVHPSITQYDLSLDSINHIARSRYRTSSYPRPEPSAEQLINSRRLGLAWYRGYHKNDVSQEEVEKTLNHFDATDIIVGHTLQSKVNRSYNNQVIAIDVAHPKDYQNYWPTRRSEGLLIDGDRYYRLLQNGKKTIL